MGSPASLSIAGSLSRASHFHTLASSAFTGLSLNPPMLFGSPQRESSTARTFSGKLAKVRHSPSRLARNASCQRGRSGPTAWIARVLAARSQGCPGAPGNPLAGRT